MSVPYYKRFARDFLEGTAAMEFELKGAYSIVLDLLHLHDGRLPDNSRYIGGQMGCSTRKATSLIQQLIDAEKLYRDGSVLRNSRMDKVVSDREKHKRPKIAENHYREITDELPQDYRGIIDPINVENINEINDRKIQETEPEPETDIIETTHTNDSPVCAPKSDRVCVEGFNEFWDSYPHGSASSHSKALGVWRGMTEPQRLAATQAAKALPKTHTLWAWSWLEARRDAPAADGVGVCRPSCAVAAEVFDKLKAMDRVGFYRAWLAPDRVTYRGRTIHAPSQFFDKQIKSQAGPALAELNITIGAIEARDERNAA